MAERQVPGKLRGDDCELDPLFDRPAESLRPDLASESANAAWGAQIAGLLGRSPFYRRKFAGAGLAGDDVDSLDKLDRVPFTTKPELQASQRAHPPFGDYLGVDPSAIKRIYQTSGTTGTPSFLALTRSDLVDVWRRIQARSYYASGLHDHSRVLTTFGAGPFVAGSTHAVFEHIGAATVPVAPGDTARVMTALEHGLVDTMLTTPSFALHLAARFESHGVDARSLGLRHVLTGGEAGGGIGPIRARIAEAFEAEVTEIYGIGDISPSLFGECPVGEGIHFSGQGFVHAELIDSDGAAIPLEPGATGEIVYTSLVRDAMPLVRYRSGDRVTILPGDCPCGRTSFRLRVVGRVDDMVIVRGVNLYPTAVQEVVAGFQPQVTGRARLVLPPGVHQSAVDPPVVVEVELATEAADAGLAVAIADRVKQSLLVRSDVRLVSQAAFGDAGYKTRLVRRAEEPSSAT